MFIERRRIRTGGTSSAPVCDPGCTLSAAGLSAAKTGKWGTVLALASNSHPARKWYIDDNIIKMNRVGWVRVFQSFLKKCFKEIINSDIAYMLYSYIPQLLANTTTVIGNAEIIT